MLELSLNNLPLNWKLNFFFFAAPTPFWALTYSTLVAQERKQYFKVEISLKTRTTCGKNAKICSTNHSLRKSSFFIELINYVGKFAQMQPKLLIYMQKNCAIVNWNFRLMQDEAFMKKLSLIIISKNLLIRSIEFD